ncbi:TonB-dependent siderophore receptor [Sphingomonas sp. NSE70-1]|uniref:TonB-dependent siderophore receptor n=1 Tax=Sphingomonas caseinilyticus TaxID=2908205 RepID=A0ABT0RW46_9SPHN|nr:TonB-dependent siderophore receptor [Sphingomonas caseinilyticus]MCL6699223.1 TonB-dependent siderophore receptor [Sphingomonas caseinilyticus]
MYRASVAALLVSTVFAAPALAAEVAAEASSVEAADLQEPIVVIGQREEYGVKSTSTATKTDTDIKDIPQTLTVISEAQIEDQQLRSIADVMYFVPGASTGTGEANRDQVTLRGNNTTADFFVNGLRDDVQYFRDFYNVDRVEVLKGPNAMIFGRGGGGGIVNRVTKQSTLHVHREVVAAGDSYGGVRLTADIDQPLGEGIGLRVNGMYENGDSFRHHVDLERYGINPTIGFMVGPNTRIDLSYEYLHDRRTTDRGVPSDVRGGVGTVDNPVEPIEGFDNTFFGDPDDSYSKADVHLVNFAIEHQFSEGLKLRNRTLYGHYDKFYQNIYPAGAALPATLLLPERVTLGAYNSRNDRENFITQTDLIWDSEFGGIDQTLLVGFEFAKQDSRNLRKSGSFAGQNWVPLTDPTVDVDVTYANLASDANNKTEATVAAVYIQDQIRISPMFEIVAGLRFDSFKLDVDDFHGAGTEFSRKDELWSPRLGLVFKPVEKLSLYASYSRSYLPQSGDQFSSLTVTTESLKPEKFVNFELGAKWEPIEGLLATAAVYQLDRSNTRAPNPVAGQPDILTGEQRSKGIELGLERSISDNWQISAGYAWQKAEVRERTTACNPDVATCNVPLVPRHSFSLWTRYDVSQQFGFGVGAVARSKSFASIGNTVKLPGYARFDAALYYSITDEIEAQLNVENLFGADYFAAAHNDNNIAPGAPTTARFAVRFGF